MQGGISDPSTKAGKGSHTTVHGSGGMLHLPLRGGSLVDGTGSAPHPAGPVIAGDRIPAVGHLRNRQTGKLLDVSAPADIPGFVDLGACSEVTRLACPWDRSKVRQDVTTEIPDPYGLSARRPGLSRRSVVREYSFAGLVVFDGDTNAGVGTLEDPCRFYPESIHYGLVNGRAVGFDDLQTLERPVRLLRR